MQRYRKSKASSPKCQHTWANNIKNIFHLKKVDFFWINRDHTSFQWFVNLLSQLESEQQEVGGEMERFLDLHMYVTSALQKNDMRALALQMALDLLYKKQNRDLITGENISKLSRLICMLWWCRDIIIKNLPFLFLLYCALIGLKSRMNAGRPNWDKVFTKLKEEKHGDVTVFFCGNPGLAKTLRLKCEEFGFDFRKEVF